MIFASSARLAPDPADIYHINQKAAHESWRRIASAIYYFGPRQSYLECPKTTFVPSEDYPPIIDLVEFAHQQQDWCAIINSDIIVTEHFLSVEAKLKARKAVCCASWRHEFDPAVGLEPRDRVDNGLDFFAANPWMWARVYQDVPEAIRIGCNRWDSWMLSYFNARGHAGSGHTFYDITPSRCICHPKHPDHLRRYGPDPGMPHFFAWPVMSQVSIS